MSGNEQYKCVVCGSMVFWMTSDGMCYQCDTEANPRTFGAIMRKLDSLEDELRAIESVKCPGCGQEVRIRRGQQMATCEQCKCYAEIRWNWQKPKAGDIE